MTTEGIANPLSLRANFTWAFVGNVVYSACQWGMLMALAKLGSAEMVGQFSLGLAITAPVIMLTNLQLRTVQATDAQDKYAFGSYLGLRLVTTTLALFVIVAVVWISGYRAETAWVVLVIGLSKAIETISDVFYGLCQKHERMDRVAGSLMIRGPLSLAMLGSGVYLTGNVLWGTAGLVAAFVLVLVSYDIHSGGLVLRNVLQSNGMASDANGGDVGLRPHWETRTLIRLARLALPLGIVMMLISLRTNIPPYFVERYLGERALGIFSPMAYLMVAGNQVVVALGWSASPRLAKYYAEENLSAFRGLLLKLAGIGVLLGGAGVLVALVAGREVLTLLYRPEYAEYIPVFAWVMVAAGFGYVGSFLGYGITATRAFDRFTIPYLTVTAVSAGSSILLIPTYGLVGAAWALCVASLADCAAPIVILLTTTREEGY